MGRVARRAALALPIVFVLVDCGCLTPRPEGRRRVPASHGEAEREGEGPGSLDQPQDAMRFFLEQRLAPGQDSLPLEHLRAERDLLVAREALQGTGRAAPTWQALGPGNIGGRTRALVIDPTDPNRMFAAGVAGGVWKTTDSGASWRAADDLMLNLSVCALALDPTDPDVIYAGTGEGYYLSDVFVRGLGIWKSVDGGATFAQLPGTVSGVPVGAFYYVNDIVVSPNDPRRLFAATRHGVWRSDDGGASWSVKLANPFVNATPPTSNGNAFGCTDLAVRPDRDPETIFAAFGGVEPDGLFRSTDGGTTWAAASDLARPNQGRMSIALAPSDGDVAYVAMADTGSGGGLGQLVDVFRTTDGGDSWEPRVDLSSRMGPWLLSNLATATGCYQGGVYSQGWYDNTIAVDPLDPDTVWVGGVDVFRSVDGATSWEIAGYWMFYMDQPPPPYQIHPDHHLLLFHPGFDGTSNQTLFAGNDGGLFRTDNARAATGVEDCPLPPDEPVPAIVWGPINNGYGVTQFYHGDSAADRDAYLGGAQDNGSSLVQSAGTPDAWRMVFGGDGGYVAIDPRDSQVMFVEYQGFPTIQKSTNGGNSFRPAVNGITDNDGTFITPIAMDQQDPDVLWTGGRRPWRTQDSAATWRVAGPDLAGPSILSAIAVSPASSDVVYLGYTNGYVARTLDGTAPNPTWTFGRNGLRTSWISSVAVDPADPDVAYATYSNYGGRHLYRTTDGGASWSDIDGIAKAGVPDIPVHWLAIRPCNSQELYAGTELGVFQSDDAGASWRPVNTGLAHTIVESLDFQDEDTLIAFTHGRGAFRGALPPCAGPPRLEEIVMAPGPGPANPSRVRALDGSGVATPTDFQAYADPRHGGQVGAGGIESTTPGEGSILTAPGPGDAFGPHVKGFHRDGQPIAKVSFYAYGTLRYGARVAGGDADGDGYDEILVTPGPGLVFGPHVRGFDHDGSGVAPIPGCSFFAYTTLRYGAEIGSADVDLGGRDDLLTGPGAGPVFGAHVRGFQLSGGAVQPIPGLSFFAFPGTHGVLVAGADLDADGRAEVIAARGPAAANSQTVRAYDYDGAVSLLPGGEVTPFSYGYGAVPGGADVDGDLVGELLVGGGADPAAPSALRAYDWAAGTLTPIAALSQDLLGATYGLDVAGADLGF